MSKTRIEWCDLSINPVKGLCPVACNYCYARKMYKRFHWNETIRFDDQVLFGLPKEPRRIFVGSTMELFGNWVKDSWMEFILQTVNLYPQHTFIFLTKKPQNLKKWSFSDNCWVGVSTTGFDSNSSLEDAFSNVKAKVKFVSIEPLLDYTPMDFRWVNWVVVGQRTPQSAKTIPNINWITDIVRLADSYRLPVFLKNNLSTILPPLPYFMPKTPITLRNALKTQLLRQEFPIVV